MRAIFLAAGISLILVPVSAFAQTDLERAAAREAADAGRTQFEAGRYAEAIDSFTRAQQLVAAPPHLLFLARAQAKLGKLVEAHENYIKITRETLPPKSPKPFVDAQNAAEQELEALEARIPSVTIAVQGPTAGTVNVLMDGETLSAAMIGMPLPVDPGRHVFEARGASAQSAPITVTLAEGGKETIMLTLRRIGNLPAPTAHTNAGPSSTLTSDPLSGADGAHSDGAGLRVASYVAFGVSALALGTGAYFLVKSNSTRNSATDLFNACNPTLSCAMNDQIDEINSKDHDADTQRNVGIGALVVGGVAAATGVTLLILGSQHGAATAHSDVPRLTPIVGFRSLGLVGTF
ncbi:MAG: hypothetical protein ABJB12_01130 [Pseudomonadota bacterium]